MPFLVQLNPANNCALGLSFTNHFIRACLFFNLIRAPIGLAYSLCSLWIAEYCKGLAILDCRSISGPTDPLNRKDTTLAWLYDPSYTLQYPVYWPLGIRFGPLLPRNLTVAFFLLFPSLLYAAGYLLFIVLFCLFSIPRSITVSISIFLFKLCL